MPKGGAAAPTTSTATGTANQIGRGTRHLARLTKLDLAETGITDKTLLVLARSPHFSGLKKLDVPVNDGISSSGLLALANSPHLGELQSLDFNYTGVDDKGVQALMRSARLPRLASMCLEGIDLAEETWVEYDEFGKKAR